METPAVALVNQKSDLTQISPPLLFAQEFPPPFSGFGKRRGMQKTQKKDKKEEEVEEGKCILVFKFESFFYFPVRGKNVTWSLKKRRKILGAAGKFHFSLLLFYGDLFFREKLR